MPVKSELYPGTDIYQSMNVWQLPKHKKFMLREVCSSGKYFAQLKKDGNWFSFHKGTNGEIYTFGRGVSVKTGFPVEISAKIPHIVKAFEQLPDDSIIIGEIYIPGKSTNAVRSVLGCLVPKALKRQETGDKLHFYMFDMIRLAGEDLTEWGAYNRYTPLRILVEYGLIDSEYVEIAKEITGDIYSAYLKSIEDGEEGIVLKDKEFPYKEGKKPAWSMIKAKKNDTADVVCMGFEDPTELYTGSELDSWKYWMSSDGEGLKVGKQYKIPFKELLPPGCVPVTKGHYYGWKASMKIGVYDKKGELVQIGSVSSGINDKLKAVLSEKPDEYLGKVLECKYMEITTKALRHPIFLRFRDDKPAEKCTVKEIFGNWTVEKK